MSGNWAIGIADIAIRPASVMTMAMTMAKRGRSIKILENTLFALQFRSVLRHNVCRHRLTRVHLLNAIGDDQLALLESALDFDVLAVIGAGRDPPLLDFL